MAGGAAERPGFIRTCAAGNPTTEDLAESILLWLMVHHRAFRISTAGYNTIPVRLAYLDAMPCDLFPITSSTGIVENEANNWQANPSPTHDVPTIRSGEQLPVTTQLHLLAADGRVVGSMTMQGVVQVDVRGLPAGICVRQCRPCFWAWAARLWNSDLKTKACERVAL